ncbi:MAG: hypothetical protein JWR80_963 [Bradyrhizobium sp.]|nr:hypothetical protein [Bradyrhizobium sp.]
MIKLDEINFFPAAPVMTVEDDEFAEATGSLAPPPPTAVGSFHINLVFNASVNNAPAGFVQAVQTAASQIEALFSDSITLNISVGWGEINGQAITRSHVALGGPNSGHYYTYAQTVSALNGDRTTPDDFTAVAALPASLNPNNNGSIAIWRAQEKALGLVGATDAAIDGNIGFATDFSSSFWVGGAIHEITHAMGRISGYSSYDILDMMRYTGQGQHIFAGGTPAYFSINNGTTRLANYDTTSDFGDFVTDSITPTDPLNAYISGNSITPLDGQIMDVIGFNRVITQAGSVSISDVNITEGPSGTSTATFTVTRTGGTAAFSVNYATAPGTATANVDYGSTSGSLNFAAGVNSQTISVPIFGDATVESDETFFVSLSGATNGATLSKSQGTGTIVNDDAPGSSISIADLSIYEGNIGTRTATFTVTRTGGSGAFAVNYASANGTATAGSDYVATSGTLSFGAGVNTQTVSVTINGDTGFENDETFSINLSGATGGTTIARAQATGSILNDDPGDDFTNNTSTTGVVAANGLATGNLEVAGDHDWFRIQLTAGVAYTIHVNGVGHNGGTLSDPYLRLYDASSTNLASNDDGGGGLDSLLVYTPATTGAFYLDVGAFADFYSGTYTVSVAAGAPADDFAASASTTGVVSTPGTVTGFLEVSGDHDWFRVQLTAGVHYTLLLLGASVGAGTLADPYERLYNASGTLVAEDDDGAGDLNSRIEFTPTSSGTYFIDAGGYANASAGTYRISVAAENRAPTVSLPSGANVTAASAGQTFQVSSLFTGSDADNNPLTYFLYDSNTAANSGHFVVNGTSVPAQTIYQVTAAQLAQATYVAGAVGTSDDLLVQAFDGQLYSGWNAQVRLTVNTPPTISLPSGTSVTASTAGQSFAFSSLFAGNDANNDPLTYFVYDGNAAANSGHWVVNGASVAAGVIYQVTASQLAQTSFATGAAGTVDDIQAQSFDGMAYSGWNAHVVVRAQANTPPTISLPSGASVTASTAGQSFAFSSLFAGSDANNDPLTYFLYDGNAAANSGHWVVNGTIIPAQTIYQVTAAQLAQTSFVVGAAGTVDDIQAQSFDGQAYSGWNAHVLVNAPANTPPTISRPSGASVTASTVGQSFAFSSLFAGNDANGDPLTYYLYDGNAAANSGHWVVNGTIVPAQTIYQLTAAQLAQTSFVVGAAGTVDDIQAQSFDGMAYSGWNAHVLVNAPANSPPTVGLPAGANVTASTAGQSFAFSSLFAGSDANGDPLTYYLYDSNAAANSGHWVVNGTIVAAQTIYPLTASQLAQTSFVAGAVGTVDDILVQAYDGQAYSGWNTQVHLSVNTPPTVSLPSGANVTASTAGQSFAFASLFAANDINGDPLTYYLYDSNAAANSGHWVVNGTSVAAGVIYQITASQLAQTSFVAGAADTADDILVQAYDGRAYSGWNAQVHVNGPANTPPTVSLPSGANVTASTAGQSIAFSSLFGGSDADNDPLTYYLYDGSPAANSGHWVVNGAVVASGVIYQVSAAQLAQTSFVTGASGTADELYVQDYDGKAYSGWNAHVHVAVPNNNAPTISLPSGTAVHATAAQSLAASGLFSGSDVNGDTLSYYVYDSNAAGNSGHFAINGTTVAAGIATLVTAAQLAQTTFVAGAAGTTDYLYVEAFDGQAYSPWTEFHVFV